MSSSNGFLLSSNVVTDAATDIDNTSFRGYFPKCKPALKTYGSRREDEFESQIEGGFEFLSTGRSDMQPKRPKDQDIYSLEGSNRQSMYDSGLGDSLVKHVAGEHQHDFGRFEVNDSHKRRGENNHERVSHQGTNHNYASNETDEGYAGSSWNYGKSGANNQLLVPRNAEGDTVLHLMILYMLLEEISFFIGMATSPSQLNIVNDMQQSPLILAAMMKQWRVVRRLLVAGADLMLTDRHGNTPLHIAARNGDLETVEELTRPVTAAEARLVKYSVETQRIPQNMNLKNYEGYAPIHLAAAEGHPNVVEYLVKLGADVDEMEAKSGLRPIHIAIENGDRELIRVLVEESFADIDATTFYSLSPVMLAAERRMDDVVVYLVNMGADRTDLDVPEISDSEDELEDMEVEFKDMKIHVYGVPVHQST
ncbi:NF-kappa-B inhibitor cactus-like [Lineus longissimus]|uniref:NF-kappa-B inhibitor cactus-like n=1 Tax=Lineus longissimus TaxID=88925 RepID=UPI00315CD5DB